MADVDNDSKVPADARDWKAPDAQEGIDASVIESLRGLQPQVDAIKAIVEKRIQQLEANPTPGSEKGVELLRGAIEAGDRFFSEETLRSRKDINDLNYLYGFAFTANYKEPLSWDKNLNDRTGDKGNLKDNKELWEKMRVLENDYANIVKGTAK